MVQKPQSSRTYKRPPLYFLLGRLQERQRILQAALSQAKQDAYFPFVSPLPEAHLISTSPMSLLVDRGLPLNTETRLIEPPTGKKWRSAAPELKTSSPTTNTMDWYT